MHVFLQYCKQKLQFEHIDEQQQLAAHQRRRRDKLPIITNKIIISRRISATEHIVGTISGLLNEDPERWLRPRR